MEPVVKSSSGVGVEGGTSSENVVLDRGAGWKMQQNRQKVRKNLFFIFMKQYKTICNVKHSGKE